MTMQPLAALAQSALLPTAARDNAASWAYFSPELILGAGVVALVLAAVLDPRPDSGRAAGLIGLILGLGLAASFVAPAGSDGLALFGGLVARDGFAVFFERLVIVAGILVVALALRAPDALDDPRDPRAGYELGACLVAAVLGACLMATATDLLTAYLGLELTSLMSYSLVAFVPGSRRSAEAALKYVVYGGVASGVLLYGFSLLYGLGGTTDLGALATALPVTATPALLLAIVLVFAGLAFKLAAAPLHMWAPDAYEGAPTPVAAFLSVAPKIGGFALLMRFCAALPVPVDGVAPQIWLLLALAVASMAIGNLAAFGQNNLKRLLAYSSIAHAGYALLGVATGTPAGQHAVLFYLGVYLVMNLAAFAVVAAAAASGIETVAGLRRLGERDPLLALAMAIALVALTGLPPTAGFVGKLYLFAAVLERARGPGGAWFVGAAVVGVLFSVASFYYYARVLHAMYLARDPAPAASPGAASSPAGGAVTAPLALVPMPLPARVVAVALAIPTLLLGLYWSPLRAAAEAALASR